MGDRPNAYLACERLDDGSYVRVRQEPFDNVNSDGVGAVMEYLAERGLIVAEPSDEGGTFWRGWGSPYFAIPAPEETDNRG